MRKDPKQLGKLSRASLPRHPPRRLGRREENTARRPLKHTKWPTSHRTPWHSHSQRETAWKASRDTHTRTPPHPTVAPTTGQEGERQSGEKKRMMSMELKREIIEKYEQGVRTSEQLGREVWPFYINNMYDSQAVGIHQVVNASQPRQYNSIKSLAK